MAERASIFQGIQLGVETTHGTEVDADLILPSLTLQPAIQFESQKYRPTGRKVARDFLPKRDHVTARLGGALSYSEIVYLLSSLINYAAPTRNIPDTGTSYTWEFELTDADEDTIKTFTVEQGSSSSRAHLFTYGLVSELELTFAPKEISLAGQMLGQELQDGITLTASPTEVAPVLVLPDQVSVYLADSYAGLEGASALTRNFRAVWALRNRHGPIWTLNASEDSWAAHVEIEPEMEVRLLVAADATGMGLLTKARAGDKQWLRIKAEGATIETTYKYTLQLDMAGEVSAINPFEDHEGVYAIEWTLGMVHDATWGQGFKATVINTLSDL